jgi:hypothetical protein
MKSYKVMTQELQLPPFGNGTHTPYLISSFFMKLYDAINFVY